MAGTASATGDATFIATIVKLLLVNSTADRQLAVVVSGLFSAALILAIAVLFTWSAWTSDGREVTWVLKFGIPALLYGLALAAGCGSVVRGGRLRFLLLSIAAGGLLYLALFTRYSVVLLFPAALTALLAAGQAGVYLGMRWAWIFILASVLGGLKLIAFVM